MARTASFLKPHVLSSLMCDPVWVSKKYRRNRFHKPKVMICRMSFLTLEPPDSPRIVVCVKPQFPFSLHRNSTTEKSSKSVQTIAAESNPFDCCARAAE